MRQTWERPGTRRACPWYALWSPHLSLPHSVKMREKQLRPSAFLPEDVKMSPVSNGEAERGRDVLSSQMEAPGAVTSDGSRTWLKGLPSAKDKAGQLEHQ